MVRIKNWFGHDHNAARAALAQRTKDDKDHKMAKVEFENGDRLYFVGRPHQVQQLKLNPKVKSVKRMK